MTALLILAAALAAPPSSENWTGFRNDGSSRTAAKNLPLAWSPTQNLAWKIETPGYGQSAPVVWNGRIYLTSIEGAEKERLHVFCFAATDGAKLWQKTFDSTQRGKNNPTTSRAAGTPVVDADGVYALFESGDLVAISHVGDVRWERHFAKEFGELKNNHGLGSSPAQTDAAVVALLDHQGPSYLIAVNKADGKDAWKTPRTSRSSWTSPVVVSAGGSTRVVASSGGAVTVYDAKDGKQLWELTGIAGNTIPSAATFEDTVVIGAGENRLKPDADATSKSNCCLKLKSDGTGEVVWRAKKVACGTASPLVHAGHAYFTDKNGFAICLDISTGEERYRERLDNPQWATPVGAGDRVYFFGKDGTTTVLKAGPNFEKLASNRLWTASEPTKVEGKKDAPAGAPVPKGDADAARYPVAGDVVYGVAAVDGTFFLRTGSNLYCVRAK